MKHDHAAFLTPATPLSIERAYAGNVSDRVRRFLPLVKRLAWHVHGSGRPGIELEDLMQAGLVALTEAAQRHAGPGEDGFAAYAKLRVRGAMVDLVRRAVPLSRSAAKGAGEAPRFESLDEVYSDSNAAFADERPDSLKLLADEELRTAVVAAIAALPQRLQLITQLYFVEELNLSEIAEVLGVSIPRVHQLKAQALGQLKAALAGVAEVL